MSEPRHDAIQMAGTHVMVPLAYFEMLVSSFYGKGMGAEQGQERLAEEGLQPGAVRGVTVLDGKWSGLQPANDTTRRLNK